MTGFFSKPKFIFPYTNYAFGEIYVQAKKEYGSIVDGARNYTELKERIKIGIRKKYTDEKEKIEYDLKIAAELEHHTQYNLVPYFSMKFTLHALAFALIGMYINFHQKYKDYMLLVLIVWLLITAISVFRGIHSQQGRIVYYRFIKMCLREILKGDSIVL
ncbi:MAG: hypothetical protein IJT96_09060 [Lachnospiraceae bacterium]|nr:hypothetical protein [Lachnospiraceae bacterium]